MTATLMDDVAKVADTVLFEGYLLYPYRASAQKNQLRWQFGVLTPQDWAREHNETHYSHTECLLEPRDGTRVQVRLRFLRLRGRRVQRAGPYGFVDVDELTVGDELHLPWEEGVPEVVDASFPVTDLLAGQVSVPVELPGATATELLDTEGRLVRETWPLNAMIAVSAEPLPGPYGALRLRLRVTNLGTGPAGSRDEALRSSLIGAHTILALTEGEFLSLTDPPEWARPAARSCTNEHTWPVLAGSPERPRLVLSSPIILADFPEIAPESPNEMFDGTENDEILTLRTLVLTDAEKREARATDPRAAALVDAVDSMPPEIFERLHGVIRSMSGPGVEPRTSDEVPTYSTETGGKPWWDPAADASVDPDTDSVLVDATPVSRGTHVRLRPSGNADAQDLFLDGKEALVEAVLNDIDGQVHLAVSLLDDPASEFQAAHGRFRYFGPHEVQVIE
ncbi:hypothetical protein [Pseudonocardia spinosispora]|uniref:hypothetical protein n=1 Tax=Pseudonocardia spinosispora TaxID=103441 RepID=UPI0004118FC1|nr:hypothetical protein [Pseudonocardia spinosispora]